MRQLVSTPKFARAYAHYTKRDAKRRKCVDTTLARLQSDPADPKLKMHQLSGPLASQFACSCGYDCRILFEWHRDGKDEAIILINVGTHDEVY